MYVNITTHAYTRIHTYTNTQKHTYILAHKHNPQTHTHQYIPAQLACHLQPWHRVQPARALRASASPSTIAVSSKCEFDQA